MRNASLVTLGLAVVLSATAFAQTLYRWTDEQGKIHYTDTPPPTNAKTSRAVTTDAAADQKAADTLKQQNDAFAKRAAERNKTPDEKAKEQADAERRARCGQLLAVVNAFDRGDPVMRQNEKGERVALPAKDRDFERQRSAQQMQVECPDVKPGQSPSSLGGNNTPSNNAAPSNSTGGSSNSGSSSTSTSSNSSAGTAGSNTSATSSSPASSTAAPSAAGPAPKK
jgi:hypothetical protein